MACHIVIRRFLYPIALILTWTSASVFVCWSTSEHCNYEMLLPSDLGFLRIWGIVMVFFFVEPRMQYWFREMIKMLLLFWNIIWSRICRRDRHDRHDRHEGFPVLRDDNQAEADQSETEDINLEDELESMYEEMADLKVALRALKGRFGRLLRTMVYVVICTRTPQVITEIQLETCETCLICQEELLIGSVVPLFPHACLQKSNFMHTECLLEWLTSTCSTTGKLLCPICSRKITS